MQSTISVVSAFFNQKENAMPLIQSIEVYVVVNGASATTADPVYVGVVTKHYGGREFPLRYQQTGMSFVSGHTYKFGFSATGGDYPPAWDSQGNGSNSLSAYPLEVSDGAQFDQRVYLRKEPIRAEGQADSALFLDDVSVTLRLDSGEAFFYRTRYSTNEEPSLVRLANEYGQMVYLYPV
ncbi:hypothetical protein [Cellvibrio sp. UBA7671]|jgi:hypothetical protein|uniref:hypothetical protein n=1 Tax=Cellvibrio sp. UBA7671 TaxID=1946312 RepID=UPI002F352276